MREALEALVEENRMAIKMELESSFGISCPEDWYSITRPQFRAEGISENCKKAMKLPFLDLLKKLYPLTSWKPELLLNVPQDTWKDQKKTRDFLEALEPELFITNKEDWYYVSVKQLRLAGAGPCLGYFSHRIASMLQFGFPEVSWDSKRFSKFSKQASQRWLFQLVRDIFPGNEVIYNYRFNPREGDIENNHSTTTMEFDVWLPQQQLALEYQGEHHYHNFSTFLGGGNTVASLHQTRDENKRDFCSRASIKLVEVPYWWDGSKESLLQILNTDE
eukprot:TRINITY_DN2768_c1_g1_i1.p1 TRINITY_DN2768_c1_g1~~TRINITY_DN2768_c1_g1_i1.p1  ORF type:complete len:276 (-),score=46.81 TRINITY_DN2768_c1_g1_i1:185-1012(-)